MAYTEQEEKKFMLDFTIWPNWPILPVKNRKLDPQEPLGTMGVVFADSIAEDKPVVYMVNMFMLHSVKLADVEKMSYESVDAMLAAGWVGD